MKLRKPLFGLQNILIIGTLFMPSAYALEVNITKTVSFVDTKHNNSPVRIQRIQDKTNVLNGTYTKTSRKCPPFCVQPMSVHRDVTTIAELEVLEFIREKVNPGIGVLVDARTPSWFKKGTIPGSINIPFSTFSDKASDSEKGAALSKLGVKMISTAKESSILDYFTDLLGDYSQVKGNLDFSGAKEIVLWCNGIWCGQSPAAIKGLLALGYPAEKIYYYRGGMQAWQSLGLTITN